MLVLIRSAPPLHRPNPSISIHLMLVLIKRACTFAHFSPYFNTSHVSVNLNNRIIFKVYIKISIHLMLVLILDVFIEPQNSGYFNTSHVSVNLTNLSLSQSCLNLSLPILSHFSKNYQPINLFLTIELITLQLQVITGFLENFFINCLVNIFII